MNTCIDCDINFLQRKSKLVRLDGEKHICTDCKDVRQDRNRAKYWNGSKNKVIRFYFYSQKGLALFNEFRYLIMAIFGVYYTMRWTNPWLLVGMFIIACPALIIVGWFSVHHIGKVVDWLSIQFSTHWGRYQYTLLEEIRDAVKTKKCDCV